MRNKKYTLGAFSFYDRSGLEKRLVQMAEKGWLLEHIGSFLWTYRRIEPQKLAFCVCWFPKASAFDPAPSEEQQTFYDFCRHTGWNLAASINQMQVFYNTAADPVPIETDPSTEVDAIHRAAVRSSLPAQLVLLVLALINGVLLILRLRDDPASVFTEPSNLFTGLCWTIVILMTCADCGSYLLWHRKAVKAAERGEFLETKGHRTFQLACLAVVGAGFIYYLITIFTSGNHMMIAAALLMFGIYLPCTYLLVAGIKKFMKKKNVPTGISRIVTIASAFIISFALMGMVTWGLLFSSARGWFAG